MHDEAATELAALQSIYGENRFREAAAPPGSFVIALPSERGADGPVSTAADGRTVELQLWFPDGYPMQSAPGFALHRLVGFGRQEQSLAAAIREAIGRVEASYRPGDVVLYDWIQRIMEVAALRDADSDIHSRDLSTAVAGDQDTHLPPPRRTPAAEGGKSRLRESVQQMLSSGRVVHGPVQTVRKSRFQGHFCVISTVSEFRDFMDVLLLDPRFSGATHNISAYRILSPSVSSPAGGSALPPSIGIAEDRDDDGETGAADKLLFLLQRNFQPKSHAKGFGIAICVSRWFGGTLLGPDRFRCIVQTARDLFVAHGLIPQTSGASAAPVDAGPG